MFFVRHDQSEYKLSEILFVRNIQLGFDGLYLVLGMGCWMLYVVMKVCVIEAWKYDADGEEEAASLYSGSTREYVDLADVTP